MRGIFLNPRIRDFLEINMKPRISEDSELGGRELGGRELGGCELGGCELGGFTMSA